MCDFLRGVNYSDAIMCDLGRGVYYSDAIMCDLGLGVNYSDAITRDLGRGVNYSEAILCDFNYLYENLNNKHYSLTVFVDFRKSFDIVVNYSVLLLKLEHYYIRGLPLMWFACLIFITVAIMRLATHYC